MSRHGQNRCQQRFIPQSTIDAVLRWGREHHQGRGRTAYFIGRAEVKAARKDGVDLTKHINTAVVVSPDGTIVTAIRTNNVRRLRTHRFM